MLKKILVVLLLLVVLVIGVNYVLPKQFSYEHEEVLDATPEQVFAQVSDFSTWPEWSAWSREKDPEAEFTVDGEPGTVGHTWSWESEGELGTGSITLTDVDPAAGIEWHLVFEAPMEGEMDGGIHWSSVDGGTKCVWWDRGDAFVPLVGRILNKLMAGAVIAQYAESLEGLEQRIQATSQG